MDQLDRKENLVYEDFLDRVFLDKQVKMELLAEMECQGLKESLVRKVTEDNLAILSTELQDLLETWESRVTKD